MKLPPLLLVLLFLLPSQGVALERFDIITTVEMEQMLTDREAGKIDFLLVNSLDRMIYNHSAIPGSINVPLSSFTQYSKKLGKEKDKLIIIYCMGYR